jgi:hypothetical protein
VTFAKFYPFYLSQHRNRACRRLHFIGSGSVLALGVYFIASARFELLWLLPLIGYGFAWIGHFFFEKNKPATFQHPIYSLMGDFVMFAEMLTRRIPF